MRFWTDDEGLSCGVDLDPDELPGVDLTREGLGDRVLEELTAGFRGSARAERAPSGEPWDELRPSTVRQKGHTRPGFRTGQMLGDLDGGESDVSARSCRWSYPRGETRTRARAFHNGNERVRSPARPLIGWTAEARERARSLIETARTDAGHEPDPGLIP